MWCNKAPVPNQSGARLIPERLFFIRPDLRFPRGSADLFMFNWLKVPGVS